MAISSMKILLVLSLVVVVCAPCVRAAEVGRKAPDFTADAVMPTDNQFKEINLSDYVGKYVVVFFYPLDFTFVCPTEIVAFSDRYEEFKALNAEVLGLSVDSKYSHLAWIEKPRKEGGLGGLKYPLVSDLKREIAEAFNGTFQRERERERDASPSPGERLESLLLLVTSMNLTP